MVSKVKIFALVMFAIVPCFSIAGCGSGSPTVVEQETPQTTEDLESYEEEMESGGPIEK
ncbi:hypothetical protein LOC67_18030 [Stieleria sp. JC731]|uniref:hypothetical protein n=1 Tax=Pirellulaceae TaxID=2691357 RepID=UPI001E611185|nr:hypothetical protein [Stieleria sp. JC731]MCC9602453.1 hypothetical protein [Stieleria sp. JC731]